jgi:hypothetical protein
MCCRLSQTSQVPQLNINTCRRAVNNSQCKVLLTYMCALLRTPVIRLSKSSLAVLNCLPQLCNVCQVSQDCKQSPKFSCLSHHAAVNASAYLTRLCYGKVAPSLLRQYSPGFPAQTLHSSPSNNMLHNFRAWQHCSVDSPVKRHCRLTCKGMTAQHSIEFSWWGADASMGELCNCYYYFEFCGFHMVITFWQAIRMVPLNA